MSSVFLPPSSTRARNPAVTRQALTACSFVRSLSKTVGFPIATTASAQVIYHHVAASETLTDSNSADLAIACLFTAAKIEDTPKKLHIMLPAAHALTRNNTELTSQDIEKWRGRIVQLEKTVLETVGFNFKTSHPFRLLVKLARKSHVCKAMARDSWKISFDCYQTVIPLMYPTYYIALGSVFLAYKVARLEIPSRLNPLITDSQHIVQAFASDVVDMYLDMAKDTGGREMDILRNIKLELVHDRESRATAPKRRECAGDTTQQKDDDTVPPWRKALRDTVNSNANHESDERDSKRMRVL